MIASPPDPTRHRLGYEAHTVDYEARRWRAYRVFGIVTCALAVTLVGWLVTLNQDSISERIPENISDIVLLALAGCWMVGLVGNCYLFCFLRLQEPASTPLTSAVRWTTSAAILHLAMVAYYVIASSR